jgi:Skp family chaperone for outer membrane proteins
LPMKIPIKMPIKTVKWERLLVPTLLATGSLGFLGLRQVAAQQKQGPLIATVDILRIETPDWTRFKSATDDIERQRNQYKNVISEFLGDGDSNAAIPPVDATVVSSWLALKEKDQTNPAAMTDADKANLVKFENQGKAATTELVGLVNKPNPTEADKARLTQLQQLQQQAQAAVNDKVTEYTKNLQTEVKATQDKLEGDVRTASAAVAQDLGITYVLRSSVVSQAGGVQPLIWYAADKNTDITDAVLKKLNQTK